MFENISIPPSNLAFPTWCRSPSAIRTCSPEDRSPIRLRAPTMSAMALAAACTSSAAAWSVLSAADAHDREGPAVAASTRSSALLIEQQPRRTGCWGVCCPPGPVERSAVGDRPAASLALRARMKALFEARAPRPGQPTAPADHCESHVRLPADAVPRARRRCKHGSSSAFRYRGSGPGRRPSFADNLVGLLAPFAHPAADRGCQSRRAPLSATPQTTRRSGATIIPPSTELTSNFRSIVTEN